MHSSSPLDGFLFVVTFDIINPTTKEVLYHRGDYITPAAINGLARSIGLDIIHVSLCTSETAAGYALLDADIQATDRNMV